MKKLLAVAVAVLFIAGCDSKPDAPFGFKWGQTVNETVAQNLKNSDVRGDESLVSFIHADSAPEPVQYKGRYFLTFYPEFGLTTASFLTEVDEESVFFNQGRVIYNQINKKLEEKYGPPSKVDENVERDGAEFYSCIKEKGCGKWERSYHKNGMNVKISVEPAVGSLMDGFSKGYIQVSYEYFTEKMKEKLIDKMKKKEISNNF